MELEQRMDAIQKKLEALGAAVEKFNSCHSPASGQFCSTKGGGGGAARGHKPALSAIRAETNSYLGVHSKKPSGSGSWAFEIGGKTHFAPGPMKYADAKKWAKKKAAEAGEYSFKVLP